MQLDSDGRMTEPEGARQTLIVLALRIGFTVMAVVAGLLAVAVFFGVLGWTWLLWIVVGAVAGIIAGRARLVWAALVGVVAYLALAIANDLPRDTGPFWVIGATAAAAALCVGFVVGSQLILRQSPLGAAGRAWRGAGQLRRRLVVTVGALFLVALIGYTGYIARIGSQEFVHPAVRDADCRTPDLLGWAYEAINYDKSDDARLAAANPDRANCSSQGVAAGGEVVSADGIRLAGWYVPAASQVGPTGPTLLIVPGWKTNKSGVLKYGAPLHDDYNLVFIDLRNSGRSGGTETTMGLREQLDLRAMIDWVVRTKNPSWLGVVGNSMGAATTLAEAIDDSRVRAVILDSAHAEIVTSTGNILETEHGQPALPGGWAIVTAVSLAVGRDVASIDPRRLVGRLGDRPVLLIHGTADLVDPPAESADLTFHAARDAGIDVELQYCQGAPHGKVIDTCPRDWAGWALSFLERARGR